MVYKKLTLDRYCNRSCRSRGEILDTNEDKRQMAYLTQEEQVSPPRWQVSSGVFRYLRLHHRKNKPSLKWSHQKYL